MKTNPQGRKPESSGILASFFRINLPLEAETCWFIFVSVLDLVLTYILLAYFKHRESNPVAEYFLHGWGIKGLIYFKMVMVAIVTLIAQVIARKQLSTARGLLILATGIVGMVVAYSFYLLMRSVRAM